MTGSMIGAFGAGAIGVGILFVWMMRRYMAKTLKIDASFDAVCENIEKAIKSVPGWVHPMKDWDIHTAVSKTHTFKNLKRKRIFFICKAEYANQIVDIHHHMGAMMPCAWGVYETKAGTVYISKLNVGLMGKLFFGSIIGTAMSHVAKEEKLMFAELKRLVTEAS